MKRRRLPSLNALRAFEAAGRHGNFSSAARELFVTHASISRHVRQLEEWLGRPLFERHSRGVSLNEAGERYLTSLADAFDLMDAATREAKLLPEGAELAISVEVTFAARWLVPRLGSFQEIYPELELNLEASDDCIDFRRDPFELAIRYGEGDWPGLNVSKLVSLEAFPVCSPDLLERRKVKRPADLLSFPLLHEDTKEWWGQWLQAADVPAPARPRGSLYQSAHMTLEAAEAGLGFALGDNVSAADGLAEGWLVKPFDLTVEAGAYWIVRSKGAKESAAAAAFCGWLREEIATFAP